MGARGNSGVILSQILRGAAKAMDGAESVEPATMAAALAEGSAAAYKAVTNPAEGTILTVVRETSEAVSGGGESLFAVLEDAVIAAGESVKRTPELLPVLAEAGVVDAGGEGLRVLLEGMLRHVRGESLEPEAKEAEAVDAEWVSVLEGRHAVEESLYGYCTEVLVEGQGLDVDGVREVILALGDSVLVVGDDTIVRVHVHTDDPGAVLTVGTGVGSLVQVKVDNMHKQAEGFVQMHSDGPTDEPELLEGQTVSCVAVASG
jgi:dihydroxyacetone kinase-like predicted kinase